MEGISKQRVEELKAKKATVHLLDVRSKEEYDTMHIPGILHIPADNVAEHLKTLDKNDTIVCVCNHGGNRSRSGAELAANSGFKDAYYLEGGTVDWVEGANQ